MRGACQVADLILMIRATRGRSRSTNHWNDSWIVRQGPKRLGFRWFAMWCEALFCKVFFRRLVFPIFGDVGWILGRFWKERQTMIRATMGMSIDREVLIIGMIVG